MRPNELVLRCYAVQDKGVWVVSCLDLCLAAQADSFIEAKGKLEDMIKEYVEDATVGGDRDHADYLLNRRAPVSEWLRYYAYKALKFIGAIKDDIHKSFKEAIPLAPCNYHT